MRQNGDSSKLSLLREGFLASYGIEPVYLTRAPGRLEILGNHTDYNAGTVLSVAVDRAMFVAIAPTPDAADLCQVVDLRNKSRRKFSLADLEHPRKGDWVNYIKGLIVELQKRGLSVPSFAAILLGEVPLSAGMSSSAALEMAMLLALCKLSKVELPWLECAKIGQACENNYVGANTGLLDQFSSLRGKAGHLIYSDFRSYEVSNVPIPAGTAFVVANSMVKHNLSNEYNERRQSCEEAVAALAKIYPGVSTLRDVSWEQLLTAKKQLAALPYQRALHVIGEITRVEKGRTALQNGQIEQFGQLMLESQQSSEENFENSCPEINTLIAIGRTLPGFLGARISGGGFGGISVHLVRSQQAQGYLTALQEAYQGRSGVKIAVMICQASDGASCLS